MTAAIEVENLRKQYEGVRALDGVSLSVPEGSFFGLLGPNGAGKTTFINILVGLVRRSGGRAEVFGHDVEDDYREARDAIGLAPQEFNVDHFFPVREVLEHKAGYHGIPADEASERADEVLKQVGIYDKRDTRFNWLSGGMKRRFMLARALITDPDLLILDEPTAGVDVQLRHDLWDLITELNESGTTILLTTHYIEEAERLCDEVAILDSGNLLTVATPEELMDRGPDKIRVTLRDAPASVPDLPMLADAGGPADEGRVESVELDGDRLVVTATQGGLVAPDLVRALDRAGLEIVDFDISRTSLEEVFVEMTREGGSDQQAETDGETVAADGGVGGTVADAGGENR
ncbi:ABC transporter ATP-binding protein [Halorussus gelatinilyticus]|uniref:ABC transporter ATP-binding protein n=1 Tax=Halorussus gelatinilyticus TaxID=2937524 RepID=A0A8U0IM26_9EURY|nr:ABC transporter ATP-binding protein [Halorussus gelatinilyticus]UPW01264.1 ABC transporter ATP-binding protein [Halorussus gelatinilyticus]